MILPTLHGSDPDLLLSLRLYLTDNKGRRMPGVYAQLSKRKVPAAKDIWVDIQT